MGAVGISVALTVGVLEGLAVGDSVGLLVMGFAVVGELLGLASVGNNVGVRVGNLVGAPHSPLNEMSEKWIFWSVPFVLRPHMYLNVNDVSGPGIEILIFPPKLSSS